jgi:xylulokinase
LGACYGDAFLAAVGSGYISSMQQIDTWVEIEREYLPDTSLAGIYAQAYSKYRGLYESTRHLL